MCGQCSDNDLHYLGKLNSYRLTSPNIPPYSSMFVTFVFAYLLDSTSILIYIVKSPKAQYPQNFRASNLSILYSHSTKPNQFCLEIILCRIRGAFDYLMYPYYPAYMG